MVLPVSEEQLSFDGSGFGGPKVRMSVTVPESLRDDLRSCSYRLGISRSALVSYILSGALGDLLSVLEEVPHTGATDGDIKRARGKSEQLVAERISQLKTMGYGVGDD